jgi:membrane associated rhomboid family serine protease
MFLFAFVLSCTAIFAIFGLPDWAKFGPDYLLGVWTLCFGHASWDHLIGNMTWLGPLACLWPRRMRWVPLKLLIASQLGIAALVLVYNSNQPFLIDHFGLKGQKILFTFGASYFISALVGWIYVYGWKRFKGAISRAGILACVVFTLFSEIFVAKEVIHTSNFLPFNIVGHLLGLFIGAIAAFLGFRPISPKAAIKKNRHAQERTRGLE